MINVFLKWLGWFVLCVVLQSTLVPHFSIYSITPDLPFLALFYLALKGGMMPGIFAGFFLGLGYDTFNPDAGMLGQYALARSVTGFICGIFNERVVRLDPVMRAVVIVVAFFVGDFIIMLVHWMKAGGESNLQLLELLVVTLPRAAYTLVFALIPFFWANFIKPPRMVD